MIISNANLVQNRLTSQNSSKNANELENSNYNVMKKLVDLVKLMAMWKRKTD